MKKKVLKMKRAKFRTKVTQTCINFVFFFVKNN